MEFKANVGIKKLSTQILLALIVAEKIYDKFGTTMTITSCNDSQHKVGSKHYDGNAVDLRTKTVGLAPQLVQAIKDKLKPLGFDVLLEGYKTPNEHCHIEYDPRS